MLEVTDSFAGDGFGCCEGGVCCGEGGGDPSQQPDNARSHSPSATRPGRPVTFRRGDASTRSTIRPCSRPLSGPGLGDVIVREDLADLEAGRARFAMRSC